MRNRCFRVLLTMIVGLAALAGRAEVTARPDSPTPTAEAGGYVDVHAQKGITCADCHGATPAGAALPAIPRERIPQLCGSCHSDVNRIKKANPSLRVDQWAQYKTSVHGIKFEHGDKKVAICTDCHSAHRILPASDPHSSIHPKNIAATCKRCHSDEEYMKPYGVKTDQFAGYVESVHSKAMVERGDLSAPTCTTCHGSHGAVPPGAASVAEVCGSCHVFQAKHFGEGPHKQVFADLGLPGCVTCHSNHRIKHPDDQFIGTTKPAACARCHKKTDPGGRAADAIHDRLLYLDHEIAGARAVLDRASRSGMEVGDSQIELSQAGDALMKARVSLHTVLPSRVEEDVQAGLKITSKAHAAGEAALHERTQRKRELLIPLLAIFAVTFSLCFYIVELERGGN